MQINHSIPMESVLLYSEWCHDKDVIDCFHKKVNKGDIREWLIMDVVDW